MSRAMRGLVSCLDDCDGVLLIAVMSLSLLGVVMVFGAASFRTEALAGELGHYYYLVKHLIRLALGVGLMLTLAQIDYRHFSRKTWNWIVHISS